MLRGDRGVQREREKVCCCRSAKSLRLKSILLIYAYVISTCNMEIETSVRIWPHFAVRTLFGPRSAHLAFRVFHWDIRGPQAPRPNGHPFSPSLLAPSALISRSVLDQYSWTRPTALSHVLQTCFHRVRWVVPLRYTPSSNV